MPEGVATTTRASVSGVVVPRYPRRVHEHVSGALAVEDLAELARGAAFEPAANAGRQHRSGERNERDGQHDARHQSLMQARAVKSGVLPDWKTSAYTIGFPASERMLSFASSTGTPVERKSPRFLSAP